MLWMMIVAIFTLIVVCFSLWRITGKEEPAWMLGDMLCAKQDCGHTCRPLAGNGGVRTKIESTMMTILEVSEMSSHPSTVSVVGKAARRVAKRRY